MSSGAYSEQSSGVGNTQLSVENFEYSSKLSELQKALSSSNLTISQKKTLRVLANTITQHLTEMDYSGVERDIAGNPVPNGKGGFFDHIQEMKDSYKSLTRARRSIEGTLKNPNLGHHEKLLLESALKMANMHIQKIDSLFELYGGIEKWKKK